MPEWDVPADYPEGDERLPDDVREIPKRQTEQVKDPGWQQRRETASAARRALQSSVTPFDGSKLFVRGPDGRLH